MNFLLVKTNLFQKCMGGIALTALTGAVMLVDWLTGYEVSIFPLYFLPLLLSVVIFGSAGGVVTAIVVVTGSVMIDIANHHHYSSEWLRYEHALMRGIVLLLVVFAVGSYKRTLETHRQRVAALEKLLTICPGCGKIAGGDGQWYGPSDYREMLKKDTYCVCPTCVSKRLQS